MGRSYVLLSWITLRQGCNIVNMQILPPHLKCAMHPLYRGTAKPKPNSYKICSCELVYSHKAGAK